MCRRMIYLIYKIPQDIHPKIFSDGTLFDPRSLKKYFFASFKIEHGAIPPPDIFSNVLILPEVDINDP